MDKAALARWVEEKKAEGISYRQMAMSMGLTGTALKGWREQTVASLSDESLRAIALYRKESVEETAAWLGIEPPPFSYDIPRLLRDFDRRMSAMEKKVEYSYQRATQQDNLAASAVLDTYLLENGINVRSRRYQDEMRLHVIEVAGGDFPGLFERLLLGFCGITPLASDDLPTAAEVLRRLTGQPWTPAEVMRVINAAQVG